MIWLAALRDLTHWQIVRYWIYALLITLAFFVLLWAGAFGTAFSYFIGIEEKLIIAGMALPQWLVNTLWGWAVGGLVAGGWFASSYLFSVVMLCVLGFYTAPVVRQVRWRHYPDTPVPQTSSVIDDLFGLLWILIKYGVVGIGLLLVSVILLPIAPLLFFLWSLMLFRRLLIADVASNINPQYNLPGQRPGLWLASLVVYLMTLIPPMNLIAPVYGVVLFSHLLLGRTITRRETVEPLKKPDNPDSRQGYSLDEGSGD